MAEIIQFPELRFLRPVAEHLPEIINLVHRNWHLMYHAHLPEHLLHATTKSRIRDLVETRYLKGWCAWQGTSLAGFSALTANCIDHIWVDANCRRRGIGNHLHQLTLKDLQDRDYQHAQVGLESFNEAAFKFFVGRHWRVIHTETEKLDNRHSLEVLVLSRPVDESSAQNHSSTLLSP